ncbi:hypothetical protein DXT99_14935 [Pontibacter diazotrophicus]|uniref:Uncharacterized protein n=1 Tax=Pontibacter diazotrophicus TaxID=1400979 RepID=A0A3D8LAN2_9BACT|nr:hypothetical protein [Pontibacter diazotrophicus]RDV14413.1 hypothetical protein DXT99_14935 [Pontibacter diazotrophicus]
MLEIIKSLLIAFFAVAVLLPVVRYALRRLSPAQHTAAMPADDLKYIQKQELKLTVAYFFFAAILTVFSAGVLALLSSIIHASEEHLFVMTPNFRAFFAPGLLLGLTLAVLPLRIVQSAVLGNDYELYQSYTQQVEGQHSTRVYSILLLVLLVVSGIVTFYALRWHVTIDQNEVQATNLLLEQRAYDMQEIESIQYLGAEGEYLVSFTDQTNINTTYLKPVQLEMIALLAERSGKRVIR